MAEAIFNHLAPEGTTAISAGSRPASEFRPLAPDVLRDMGIETDGLRPKLLTRKMVRDADRIVTMGCPEACPAVGKPPRGLGDRGSIRGKHRGLQEGWRNHQTEG